jgi:hypothetical protein
MLSPNQRPSPSLTRNVIKKRVVAFSDDDDAVAVERASTMPVVSRIRRSPTIPIQTGPSSYEPSRHHDERDMEQALAERRDYVFFARVVHGIQQTQRKGLKTPQCSMPSPCYYENEFLLHHVVKMRHTDPDDEEYYICSRYGSSSSWMDGEMSSSGSSASLEDGSTQDEDDCIFHLEL